MAAEPGIRAIADRAPSRSKVLSRAAGAVGLAASTRLPTAQARPHSVVRTTRSGAENVGSGAAGTSAAAPALLKPRAPGYVPSPLPSPSKAPGPRGRRCGGQTGPCPHRGVRGQAPCATDRARLIGAARGTAHSCSPGAPTPPAPASDKRRNSAWEKAKRGPGLRHDEGEIHAHDVGREAGSLPVVAVAQVDGFELGDPVPEGRFEAA